jgi:hypothetical protein
MPCFFRLACSLVLSHSKAIASPDSEYTDAQYLPPGDRPSERHPVAAQLRKGWPEAAYIVLWRRMARHGR